MDNNIEINDEHLSDKDLVEYIQKQLDPPVLQQANEHLVKCSNCGERLSLLILFEAENRGLEPLGEQQIEHYLASNKYQELKESFINEATRRASVIKKIKPRSFRISFSFSFDIKPI